MGGLCCQSAKRTQTRAVLLPCFRDSLCHSHRRVRHAHRAAQPEESEAAISDVRSQRLVPVRFAPSGSDGAKLSANVARRPGHSFRLHTLPGNPAMVAYFTLRMVLRHGLCFGDATPSSRFRGTDATGASRLHGTCRPVSSTPPSLDFLFLACLPCIGRLGQRP
jgi:hypothetical protein